MKGLLQVEPRILEARVDLQRGAEVLDRFVEPAAQEQHVGQVVVRLDLSGQQLQGAPVALHGLGVPFLVVAQVTQIVVQFC